MTDSIEREAAVRESLERSLGVVFTSDLAAHLKRDGVIVVAPTLSLLDCAVAIALDDKARVAAWLADGSVRRASEEERAHWPSEPQREWLAVVVQPFVLVQLQQANA
jgi:hypothetical protein